tara:strand:- start:260 stop:472 length:213 start_codon:yes stop_codon:yes gene_type:complete
MDQDTFFAVFFCDQDRAALSEYFKFDNNSSSSSISLRISMMQAVTAGGMSYVFPSMHINPTLMLSISSLS